MAEFRLKITTPEKVFFDGMAERLIARTTEGDIGILAGHVDYVSNLPSGAMKIKQKGGEFRAAAIADGLLKVSKSEVSVLCSAIEWSDEIDVERAKRAEAEARKLLAEKLSERDEQIAKLKLSRALNRINVAEK